jgi:hypothetical protein
MFGGRLRKYNYLFPLKAIAYLSKMVAPIATISIMHLDHRKHLRCLGVVHLSPRRFPSRLAICPNHDWIGRA